MKPSRLIGCLIWFLKKIRKRAKQGEERKAEAKRKSRGGPARVPEPDLDKQFLDETGMGDY